MGYKLILAVLACTCVSVDIAAQQKQNPKAEVATKYLSQNAFPHWKKGDTKTFFVNHSTEKTENGKPTVSSGIYYASVKVVDSSSDGYTMQWNYIPPPPGVNSADAKETYELFKGLSVIFTTSDKGMFTDLVNWKELRDFYIKLVGATIPKEEDGSADSTMEKVKKIFGTKQMIMSTMAKEIMLLFQVYGKTYTPKGTVVNTELPNPFIPVRTIPALLSMKLTEVNSALNHYKIVVTSEVDKEGMSEVFNGLLDKMDIKGKDSSVAEVKKMLSNFQINDYTEYQVKISTGWVSRMLYRRTVSSNFFSQKDAYLIEEKKF
jgi:hypothetical protein